MNQTPPPYDPYRRDQWSQPMADTSRIVEVSSGAMKRVYFKMCLAMIVTGLTCLLCYSSPAYWQFIRANSWAVWGGFIAEFVLVLAISAGFTRWSTMAVTLMFYLFAVVNGVVLTPIFIVYTGASLAKTFFITAGTFGAMTIYGYFTNRDLTRWGNFFFMALIGLIIAMLVNLFLKSSGLEWIISVVGVLLFVGLTAWDTQFIKRMAAQATPEMEGKIATYGALNLYLDFINLFLFLLRFFGASRD